MKKLTKQKRSEIYFELAEFFENSNNSRFFYVCNELLKKINLYDKINGEHWTLIDKLRIEAIEKYFPEFFLFKHNWEYIHWFSKTHFQDPSEGRALSLFLCCEMTK